MKAFYWPSLRTCALGTATMRIAACAAVLTGYAHTAVRASAEESGRPVIRLLATEEADEVHSARAQTKPKEESAPASLRSGNPDDHRWLRLRRVWDADELAPVEDSPPLRLTIGSPAPMGRRIGIASATGNTRRLGSTMRLLAIVEDAQTAVVSLRAGANSPGVVQASATQTITQGRRAGLPTSLGILRCHHFDPLPANDAQR